MIIFILICSRCYPFHRPYLKSKKEIIEITTAVATAAAEELHLNDEIIVVEPKPKTEIIVRYTNADLLSLMSSKSSKKKPRLDSRCFRIQTNNGNLMKTLKADLNNLIKTKIEPYEVNSPLIITQSCPSLSKYPQGMIRISLSETKVMKGVENAWTPKCIQVNVNVADGLEQEIVKKFRSVLNKLCPENFNKMLEEVKVLEMNSSSVLNQCIRLLFEKAIADVCFTPTYALMCASIRDLQKDKCVFLTHLVSFCQEEFERFQKGFDDNTDEEGQKKFHRDTIGTVRFIGELYNIKIVDDKIAGECIKMLMDPKTIGDVSLESLCNLLKTIGSRIEENNKITELIDDCYKQLHDIITNKTVAISSRIKFAIMDLLELKTSCWKERRIVEAPKKLNEIADAMQKEDDKNAELTRRFCQNNRISRNFNDINNKMSTTTVVDQRYKNVNGNHTEVNSVDQIDVNATVRNTSNPDNYINNTNTKIMINNSTKNVVKKVHFEINNDEDILKIKKFKKSKYKSSFDRPNTSITIEKRNDYRYQRTDDKINQTNNFVAKNPVVNNRCKDFSDTPRIQPRFHQSHHDNYEPKNRKVEGNNSNRQQHQEQWISRGFNNRRDVSRNDNNQHGDHANYDNSYKTCYKSITKNQIYHEPNIIRETVRVQFNYDTNFNIISI